MPALLQTAVAFHSPYSVNEKSSLLLCLSYCPGFASLRQVNSSSSQDKFQICCTDVYLVEFLANFAVFHVFLSISRDFADIPEFRGSATARNFRSPAISMDVHESMVQEPNYKELKCFILYFIFIFYFKLFFQLFFKRGFFTYFYNTLLTYMYIATLLA